MGQFFSDHLLLIVWGCVVLQFTILGIIAYKDRDTRPKPPEGSRHDPSRASWVSSAMQDDMGGDG